MTNIYAFGPGWDLPATVQDNVRQVVQDWLTSHPSGDALVNQKLTALETGKADKTHTHTTAQVDGLAAALAAAGKVQSVLGKTGEITAQDFIDAGLNSSSGSLELQAAKDYADSAVNVLAAKQLPDNGRATPGAFPSVDAITVKGTYSVWSTSDANAMGLPFPGGGRLDVLTYGNIVVQRYEAITSAGPIVFLRQKAGTAAWSEWGNARNLSYEARLDAIKAGATKTAAVSLSTGDSGGTEKVADRSFRYPFKFGADVQRWRVHIRNTNPRYGNTVTGAISFAGLGVARNASDTVGYTSEGQLAGSVTTISENFQTPANGTEWVSPWVDKPIKAGESWLLTGGYTTAADQTVTAMVAGGWVTTSATDWKTPNPAGLALTKSAPLWVWLEVEVDSKTPVIMYLGDSLASGVSARLPCYDSIANRHSWAHGHIASLYANSGHTMTAMTEETAFSWRRYDSARNLAKPDGCVWEIGSNDIFNGLDITTLQSHFDALWDIVNRKFTNRVALMTILPRHDTAAAAEDVRQVWNHKLLTDLAGRAIMTVDTAAQLTNPDKRTLMKDYAASPSDIHLTAAGYARYIQGVPPLHT